MYDPCDDVICNILIYAHNTTLYSKCDKVISDLWQQSLATKLKSGLGDTADDSR